MSPPRSSSSSGATTTAAVASTPEELRDILENAGFANVTTTSASEPVLRTLEIRGGTEEYFNRFALSSPPVLSMIEYMEGNMEDGTANRFRNRVMELAAERGGGGGSGGEGGGDQDRDDDDDDVVRITSPAYFAYGTRPSD